MIQGGGVDQYGNSSAIMNFEIAAQGMGAKYVLDGTDTCAAMFNPEGDAGDVEMWELICPMIYPVIGDVHNADVQTFVPIFWEGELVAWAGGVTHVLDIGASTPGGVPVGPTNRLDDGIDLPCMKIGEDDELAQWHLSRCERKTRAPMYYLLDERTRLAGCHMIREAVERVILEEGIDRFKQFSRG